jgi:mannose-6-phosphate isomerase-like protein (cupin superfamily)
MVLGLLRKNNNFEKMKKINFKEKFQKFSDQWSPKVIAEMNDYQFKLVKIQNDFIWHKHEDTDEVFIVLNGKIFIEFEDETIEINQGEMIVVPKGVKHKPYAKDEANIMLVEPSGVINTGDKEGDLTAPNDQWV